MFTTSASLLTKLKDIGQPAAWSRFVRLYSPMIYSWSRRMGLQDADALDLVQDVFASLVQKLPEFNYDSDRGFRSWLWIVTRNKFLERSRRRKLPIDKAFFVDDAQGRLGVAPEEEDFRRHLLGELVPSMSGHFPPSTWNAFWGLVVEGRPAQEVADALDLSLNAVYKAKARVVSRLHGEFADLMGD